MSIASGFRRLKFAAASKIGSLVAEHIPLPERIQLALSGLGDVPQFGRNVDLARIQEAIMVSERGEPYYLFGLFRDMIENDSHIQAEMGKRIMSFIGQNQTIEPFDKDNQDDVAAADAIKDMIEHCDNWSESSLHLAGGHIWPVAGGEKIYEPVDSSTLHEYKHAIRYRLKEIHPIPYPLFTYRLSYQNVDTGASPASSIAPNYSTSGAAPINDLSRPNSTNPVLTWNPNDWHADLRFYSTLPNGQIDWNLANGYKPDPMRHVLHSANVATASMRENFGGVLRGLIFWWFLSTQGRDWFARAMERYGSPFVVGWGNTANKNVFDLLTKAFNQATVQHAMVLPTQCSKLELKEVQTSGMADGYAKFIELCNTEKTKAILGQTLSTTSKGSGMMGGSGVADLHGEVRSEWTIFDKRKFGEMERKQIFEPYLRINGFKGRAPKSIRGGLTPANQMVVAKTFQALATAGIFPEEGTEQDLTNTFGYRMRIIDPMKLNMPAGGKSNGGDAVKEN